MRRFLFGCFLAVVFSGGALAALHFPALTGRVVDEAGILSAPAKDNLEQTLAAFEGKTTDQVVVVTLRSLEGVSIEDYGYQLGRFWGIGQKDKNNGVLLIVAPKERKVRIEVGYGLEGTLTDAAASEIVQGIVLPDFRAGHMEQGIVDGANAIVTALGGAPGPAATSSAYVKNMDDAETQLWTGLSILVVIAFFLILWVLNCPSTVMAGPLVGGFLGGFGSGFGGGGFSGGGGGFGGGGASGGW